MNVEADKDIEREVSLTRRTKPIEKPKLEERLKPYALAPDAVRAELTLKRDMRVALDDRFPDKSAVHNLAAGTVADLKRWLGSPDNVLGHDRPKFGTLPDDRILEGVTVERFPPSKLTAEQRVALAAISREYLYGNSTSVSKYSPLIDGYFKSKFDKAILNIPLYGFSRVEIGPGATLEIGGSSSVFFTSLLRIHTSGTLSVVGSVKADIGRYEEFS